MSTTVPEELLACDACAEHFYTSFVGREHTCGIVDDLEVTAEWHPAPVRLTVEEACYWATIASLRSFGLADVTRAIVVRDIEELQRRAKLCLASVKCSRVIGVDDAASDREQLWMWWLCRQAIAAIGREART